MFKILLFWVVASGTMLAQGRYPVWETLNFTEYGNFPTDSIMGLAVSSGGDLWIGTESSGVARKSEDGWEWYHPQNSPMPDGRIKAVFAASNGTVWFGTDNGGAAGFDGQNWTLYNSGNTIMPSDKIVAIHEGPGADMWFSSFHFVNGGVLRRTELGEWTLYNALSGMFDNYASSIAYLNVENKMLFGNFTGLSEFNLNTQSWSQHNVNSTGPNGLPHNSIYSLVAGAGDYWVGTFDGLARNVGGEWSNFTMTNSPLTANSIIYNIRPRPGHQELWLATSGGLVVKRGSAWMIYTAENSGLPHNNVRDVAFTPDGSIWIATYGGLTRLNFQNVEEDWLGSSGGDGDQAQNDAIVDALGNRFVLGMFSGNANIAGQSLTSAGGTDLYVAKFSATGEALWARALGGPGNEVGYRLAVTAAGDVMVAASFEQSLSFAGETVVSQGGADGGVFRLTSGGGPVKIHSFGSVGSDRAVDVGQDALGHIVVLGDFAAPMSFAGETVSPNGGSDVFVARLTSGGGPVKIHSFGSVGSDRAAGMDFDPLSGEILVVGDFAAPISFAGETVSPNGGSDVFVARLTSGGGPVKIHSFGSVGSDRAAGVGIDPLTNDVAVAGDFFAPVSFAGETVSPNGGADVFVARMTSGGGPVKIHSFGSVGSDRAADLGFDFSGNLYVVGSIGGIPIADGFGYPHQGQSDGFVARLTSGGGPVKIHSFGSVGSDRATSVDTDPNGVVYIGGEFQSSMEICDRNVVSGGGIDFFHWNMEIDRCGDQGVCVLQALVNDQASFCSTTQKGRPRADHRLGFGAVQYRWKPEALYNDPHSPHPTVQYVSGSVYSLEVTSEAGCTAEVEWSPSFMPEAKIYLTWPSAAAEEFGTLDFHAVGADAYRWELTGPENFEPRVSEGVGLHTFQLGSRGTYHITLTYSVSGCEYVIQESFNTGAFVGRRADLAEAFMRVYPNPARDQVEVSWLPAAGESELVLTDLAGRIVRHATVRMSEGKALLDLPQTGTYFLRLGDFHSRLSVEK